MPRSQAVARAVIEQELVELRSQVEEQSALQSLPDRFDLAAHMPHADWKLLVAKAVAEMDQGAFTKVVLARRVDVIANRPFVLPETLSRLATLYPSCAVFHVEGFIGASPETLVRRTGHDVLSHPLAGTVARSGDTATDAALLAGLMASGKDRHEHQLVVDEIASKLRPLCRHLEVPAVPSVLALRNVSHLGTELRGTLADGAASSLALAALLQPTPAVGGLPTEAALAWQRDNEGFDRGTYAGPVGWVDGRGDGEWVLGLRSAHVSGCQAALYAGNGIVAASAPDAELAETQLKLQALLAALVRP
jgi:menaquinone-specific isochorismate synthase